MTPIVITLAGSDCSGGAGIQADIKTISALGAYAASVITAVTAQNTLGVQAVYPMSAESVDTQLHSVFDDLVPSALKIGMVPNASIASTITTQIRKLHNIPVVYDPVMISTSGRRLMAEDAVQTITESLFPLCTLITPNLHEATYLYDRITQSKCKSQEEKDTLKGTIDAPITKLGNECVEEYNESQESITLKKMNELAQQLAHTYQTSVLVKGGHLAGEDMCDVLYDYSQQRLTHYTSRKIHSCNLHGTGCTLSSAIATYMAEGCTLDEAVTQAKSYINRAIERGKNLHIGRGNGPLWHFCNQ